MADPEAPDSWACAQDMLAAWPDLPKNFAASGTCRRLRDALVTLPDGGAGWLDIAALVRQVLLEQEARHKVAHPLIVPGDPLLPTRQQWKEAGCVAYPTGDGKFQVRAESWHPPVPPEEVGTAAEDLRRVYQGTRKAPKSRLADPFWTETFGPGYDTYTSLGQRQAARTVALAPPGSTTIVCLPTGQGKTEVALAPALLTSRERGVSLIVVPTVILSLDMERRVQELLSRDNQRRSPSNRYAYTGDMSDSGKQQIRDAVREGTQRVVIAAPEAVERGLGASLSAAAEAGYLKYMVLDEAHLVHQWGSGFRPEFQTLAKQRLSWLEMAPRKRRIITIAMSATLTEQHVQTLTDLFGSGQDVPLIYASETRPEPSYYLASVENRKAREVAIDEAVARLPRPLVLYVSTQDDAKIWAEHLRESGLSRIAVVTGDSDHAIRQEALDGWRGRHANGDPMSTTHDIVIGTSAFGLGVDMPDVRSVVHACLPETLDRYYQEVGRGGRDGRPSIAYLVKAPSDEELAARLNQVTLIGPEKGWDRWSWMRRLAPQVGNRTYKINLDALPARLPVGYGQSRQWNVRTLNMMVGAGLIQLRSLELDPPTPGEDPEEFEARREAFFEDAKTHVLVEIRTGDATNHERWMQAIERQRRTVAAEQQASLRQIRTVLRGEECVGVLVGKYYTLHRDGGRLRTEVNCRGCPQCRATRKADPENGLYRKGLDPHPPVRAWPGSVADPLAHVHSTSPWLSIWWENEDDRRYLLQGFLERLVERRMNVFGGPGLTAELAAALQETAQQIPVITDLDGDLAENFSEPVAWLLTPETTRLDGPILNRFGIGAPTYLLHSRDLADPDRPNARFADTHSSVSLRTALGDF